MRSSETVVQVALHTPYFEIQIVNEIADGIMQTHSSISNFCQVMKIYPEWCLVDLHNCTSERLK